jgi:2'-5' RNA ligase
MDDFQNSVMIALVPTTSDWCHIALPHLTLVYAGEIPTLKPTAYNELAKIAIALAMTCEPLSLDVIGLEILGNVDKVEVLLLQPSPALLAMRSVVESWTASEFPFKPHVTIGPVGSNGGAVLPTNLIFDRIMVGWGDSRLTYRLGGGMNLQ